MGDFSVNPRQIELVQETWAQVAPRADEAGRLFYANLFALAPQVRSLFGGDIEAQSRKLMTMISYAVKGLNRLEALRPGLEALGRRHVEYGVRDEHYAIVGKALFTPVGLAFASSYYLIPRVVMALLPILVNFDRAQLAAAESLGATRAQAFRHVLLPQVAGPVVAAACLVAAVVFGAYGTALALVGTQLRILPLQLYSLVSETGSDFPAAAALALMITAACSVLMAAGEAIGSRHARHLAG